jgi:hypothetical protein
MTQASDIVAEIARAIPSGRPGSKPWWERTAPEHEDTLAAIHSAWHAGEFGPRRITAARVIAKTLNDMGIEIGEQGVIAWLKLAPRS